MNCTLKFKEKNTFYLYTSCNESYCNTIAGAYKKSIFTTNAAVLKEMEDGRTVKAENEKKKTT
ncbi:MAG TPA: hypothetical protein PK504_07135 [Ferruginibacter sp.]|nr:hypothetical protein [Ferruginibacter sp.]HRE62317.1 hypothetical protein [Ferruginibacter sp.]